MEKLLFSKMEKMKKQMMELAQLKGLDHPEVLEISQQIDELHNRINRIAYFSDPNEYQPFRLRRPNKKNFIKESASEISAYFYAVSGI